MTSIEALDDRALTQVLSQLDSESLAACAQVQKRFRGIVEQSIVWRQPFETTYPHWAVSLRPTTDWRAAFRRRHLADLNWALARVPRSSEVLRAHAGPIFSTAFLQDPFPCNLALSAGVYGQHERAELTLWDLSRRLGWQLLAPPPEGDSEQSDNLCGAFDVRQRPGRQQVVVCGFSPEVNVYELRQCGDGSIAGAGEGSTMDSSGSGDLDPGADELEQQIENILQLRSASNLRFSSGLVASGASLPAPGERWEAHLCLTLVGHESACPTARCQGDMVATGSFDGSIKLWRLPEAADAAVQGEDADPALVTPVASMVDDLTDLNPLLELHNKAVCGLALNHDLTTLVSGSNDTLVKLWSVERQQVISRFEGHEGWVWSIEALDDGSLQTIISGATDGTARVWDTRIGQQVAVLSFFPDANACPVAGLAVRSDNRYLAAGCFDATVRISDLRTYRVCGALEGHTDRVTRLAGEGDFILSGSFDGNCRLWSFLP